MHGTGAEVGRIDPGAKPLEVVCHPAIKHRLNEACRGKQGSIHARPLDRHGQLVGWGCVEQPVDVAEVFTIEQVELFVVGA